jgi:putative membrane protein
MTPSAPQAAPGVPAPPVLNLADRLFIRELTIGGMAEVQNGQLAEERGGADVLKAFGRDMVADHSKAGDQLSAIAKADGIAPPDRLDEQHRMMRAMLEGLNGRNFDLAYIRGQVTDHQQAAQLLEWEIGSGENARLKSFAANTLPIVLGHLERARDLATQLAAQTAASAISRPAPANSAR